MIPVFLDTSGLIALADTSDKWHDKAAEVWQGLIGESRRLVTTSLVLIELADGLSRVKFRTIALQIADALRTSPIVDVVRVPRELEDRGWDLFRARHDKDWGMTDCISIVLMSDRQMEDVFGLDHHFEQAGYSLLIK